MLLLLLDGLLTLDGDLGLLRLNQVSSLGVKLYWELLGNLWAIRVLANIKLLGNNLGLLELLGNNLGLLKLLGNHLLESKLLRNNLLWDDLLTLNLLKLLLGNLLLKLLGREVLRCLLLELLMDNLLLRINNLLSLLKLLDLELLLLWLLLDGDGDSLPREPAFSLDLLRLDRELLRNLGTLVLVSVLSLNFRQDFWKSEGLVLDLYSLPGWPLLLILDLLLDFFRARLIARFLGLLGYAEGLGWDPGGSLAAFPVGLRLASTTRNESGEGGGSDGPDVGHFLFDHRVLVFDALLLLDRANLVDLDLINVVLVLGLHVDGGEVVVGDLRPGGHRGGEEEKCQDLHRVRQ